jgi:predicted ATPase
MSGAGQVVLSLAKRLYRETEGNPFFLMEMIKALFEADHIRLKEGVWEGDFDRISQIEFPMPGSMYEAVQERVQRLPANMQEGLHLAAVLGREFSYEVLNAAWGKGEEAALALLDELLRHRLVEEKAGPGDNDIAFTHHKLQEIVYQGLPRHRCNYLHAQAGAALETIYAAEFESRSGELAYHFEQACRMDRLLSDKAIGFLMTAGKQAVRQFAHQEAIAFYRRSLAILNNQPTTDQRMRQEVELLLALAVPMVVIHGYASAEIKHVYDRVRGICQALGNTPDLFTALVGLSRYCGVSGDCEMGLKLSEQLFAVAHAADETDMLLEACRQRGGILYVLGRLQEARHFWEKGLALYRLEQHEQYAYRYGHDPAATCLGYLSLTLWLLGYPEQSLVKSQDLFQLIPSLTHPPSQAYAYCFLAKQACFRSAAKETNDHAGAAIHISQLHGLSSWMFLATALKGWALLEQGMTADGEALLKEGTTAWQARGFAHFTPFLLALQAESCLRLRKPKEGMDALLSALALTRAGGDQYWMAEITRLQGELLWESGGDGMLVEAKFHQAIEEARQQGARMLELRAAVSLARLWQAQGRRQAAHQVLAPVYDQFTEGFDTRDLKAARNLLCELQAKSVTKEGRYHTSGK